MIKKSIVGLLVSVMMASAATAVDFDTEVSFDGSSAPTGVMYYDAGNFDVAFGLTYETVDGENTLDLDLGVRTELPGLGESSIVARIGEDADGDDSLESIRLTKSYRVEIANGIDLGARLNILNIQLDDLTTASDDDDTVITLLSSIEPIVAVNVDLF